MQILAFARVFDDDRWHRAEAQARIGCVRIQMNNADMGWQVSRYRPGLGDNHLRHGFRWPCGRIAAAQLDVDLETRKIQSGDDSIRFWIHLENTQTGHNLPSGFSQEREVWVELIVRDESGILYEVGTLVDTAHPETGEDEPDGLLHEEDLRHRDIEVDFDTLQADFVPGPHADLRPDIQLGMISLTNDFVFQEEDGTRRVVLLPNLANHTDNSRALAPFERRAGFMTYRSNERCGANRGAGSSTFSRFSSKFLRLLSKEAPDLVTEEMVDKNTIVDMAQDFAYIQNYPKLLIWMIEHFLSVFAVYVYTSVLIFMR